MSALQTSPPSRAEVDAAEKVLAEAHGMNPDGYFRPMALAALEAARDAAFQEFLREVDSEFDRTVPPTDRLDSATGQGRR